MAANSTAIRLWTRRLYSNCGMGANIDAFTNGPVSAGIFFGGGDRSYHAQWWLRHTESREAFSALGVKGQWIYIDVDRNITITKQSSRPEASANKYVEFNINAYDSIIGYLAK